MWSLVATCTSTLLVETLNPILTHTPTNLIYISNLMHMLTRYRYICATDRSCCAIYKLSPALSDRRTERHNRLMALYKPALTITLRFTSDNCAQLLPKKLFTMSLVATERHRYRLFGDGWTNKRSFSSATQSTDSANPWPAPINIQLLIWP